MTEQDNTNVYSSEDIEKNKVVSALAYILFFLPLIACADFPLADSMPIRDYYCL